MDNISISLGKRQLVDSIWKSAGIEGLGTTFPDTQKILDNIPTKTTAEEVLFIVNMKRAWNFVFDNIDAPNNLSLLREINKICMDGLMYGAGSLRSVPVSIGGTSWRPEYPHEGVVMRDLEKIDADPDKLNCALDMFCYVARSQMFLDGNKRAAQLICNKVMMENDLGVFSVPYDSIGLFSDLLVSYYESGDSFGIKSFFKKKCLLLNYNNPVVAGEFGVPDGFFPGEER